MSTEQVVNDRVWVNIQHINPVPMMARKKAQKDMMSPIVLMIVFHPASAASALIGKVTDVWFPTCLRMF